MAGRATIHSHQQRIEAVFDRSASLYEDAELLADHAKYLCVLVSGFIETSLTEMVLEHARRTGAPSLQRYVQCNISRFTNANSEKILQLLGSLDVNWRKQTESILIDKYKEHIDSIIGLRHQIAHGSSVGVTYVRIKEYFASVKHVISYIQDLCIP